MGNIVKLNNVILIHQEGNLTNWDSSKIRNFMWRLDSNCLEMFDMNRSKKGDQMLAFVYPSVKYRERMLGFYERLGELEELAMHGNSESFSEAFFKTISLMFKWSTNEWYSYESNT